MLKKIIFNLLLVMGINSVKIFEANHYVYNHDDQRLRVVNDIYNPVTIEFIKKMGLESVEKVIDLGCGNGMMTVELHNVFNDNVVILGIDNSREILQLAEQYNKDIKNTYFELKECYDLFGIADNSIDYIFSRFLLTHLPRSIADRTIQELYRVLKPGGKIVSIETLSCIDTMNCYPKSNVFEQFKDLYGKFESLDEEPFLLGNELFDLYQQRGFNCKTIELFHPALRDYSKKSILPLCLKAIKPFLLQSNLADELFCNTLIHNLIKVAQDDTLLVHFMEIILLYVEKSEV